MKHKFEYYCEDYENIKNYEKAKADNFKNWCCHHRLQTWTLDGQRRDVDISAEELKALDMYYNRPAEELIFLRRGEHSALHNKMKLGKKHSEETKQKIGEARKGEKHPMYGKHHSEEVRKQISKAKTIKNKGCHWFNNGKENKFCRECPEGFVPGKLIKK